MKNIFIYLLITLTVSNTALARGGGGFSSGRSSGGGYSSGRSSGYSSSRSSSYGSSSSSKSSGYSSSRSSGSSSTSKSSGRTTPAISVSSPRTTIRSGGRTYYVSHTYYGSGGHSFYETWYSPMYFWLPWNIWHPHTIVYAPSTIIEHDEQQQKEKACFIPKCNPKKDKGCPDSKANEKEFGGHAW